MSVLVQCIIASEQSGVECACACVLVENCIVAYLELRRTLRYVQRPRDIIYVPVETTRSARSLAMSMGVGNG